MTLDDIAAAISPLLPPAVGALAGLPYAKDQTPMQKVVSFGVGVAVGYYVGGAVAEYFELKQRGSIACGFLFGVIGYDAMVFAVSVARNPLQSVKDWWGVWRNK